MRINGIHYSTNAEGKRTTTLHTAKDFNPYYSNTEAGRGCFGQKVDTVYVNRLWEILAKAKKLNPNGTFVFEPNGRVMTTDNFNRRLKKYCKEAGIEYHPSHKIRFYNASTAYDGKNLTTISRLMGHSAVETTLHYLRNTSKNKYNFATYANLGLSST